MAGGGVNCQGASRLPWTREQRRSKELDNSEGCGVRRPVAAGITDGRATIPCRHRSARASESLVRPDNSQNQSSSTEMGCAGLILRLLWFIAGHLALVVFALLVAQRGRFSFLDLGHHRLHPRGPMGRRNALRRADEPRGTRHPSGLGPPPRAPHPHRWRSLVSDSCGMALVWSLIESGHPTFD
jgi:hypothetical protein